MQDRRIAEVLIKHLDCVNRVAVVIQTTVYQVHFSFKMTGKMISSRLAPVCSCELADLLK